jgi:hypothetical protein
MQCEIQNQLCMMGPSSSSEQFNTNLTIAISSAINVCIPKRVVHLRRDTDITNYHVEAAKKKRDHLIKRARKLKCPDLMAKVTVLNKKIKFLVKRERARIMKAKMKDSSSSTFWKTVGDLLGKNQTSEEYQVRDSDGNVMSEELVAQAFADFFQRKVTDLVARNPIRDVSVDLNHRPIAPFSQDEVRKAVSMFKPKRLCGPDEIPMVVIKDCINVLVHPIVTLFELITREG